MAEAAAVALQRASRSEQEKSDQAVREALAREEALKKQLADEKQLAATRGLKAEEKPDVGDGEEEPEWLREAASDVVNLPPVSFRSAAQRVGQTALAAAELTDGGKVAAIRQGLGSLSPRVHAAMASTAERPSSSADVPQYSVPSRQVPVTQQPPRTPRERFKAREAATAITSAQTKAAKEAVARAAQANIGTLAPYRSPSPHSRVQVLPYGRSHRSPLPVRGPGFYASGVGGKRKTIKKKNRNKRKNRNKKKTIKKKS